MKWDTVLSVFLLGCLAIAIPIEPEGAITTPEGVIHVNVWVHENGQTLSVETLHPTATVSNEPTALPPILPIPDNDAPHALEPAFATATDANTNAKGSPNLHEEDSTLHPEQNTRFFGISYSPYNADNTCKNQEQVNADIDKLTHYAFIRIYGVDCDQTRKVITAARRHELKVFAGVYDLQNLHANLKMIIDAAEPDLSTLHTTQSETNLSTAARIPPQMSPKLLTTPVSDYCAANCHAFFDADQTPEDAGTYVRDILYRLSEISSGKRALITESGWPHGGQSNGRAVPSPENQQKAIDSLRRAFWNEHDSLVLFSAFDDLWKVDNEWTFGAERFWGIQRL